MFRFKIVLLTLSLFGPPAYIGEARQFFEQGKFAEAEIALQKAIEFHGDKSPEIWYNIGQCRLAIDSTQQALEAYGRATDKHFPVIGSYALNNAGVIRVKDKDGAMPAMEAFKEALRRNPDNELARYNLELLKKLQQQQEQQQEQQEQEQEQEQKQDQKQQQQKQDPKANPKEGKGEKQEYREISPEQAKMILEGMKDNEKQFIQQLHKSAKTKPENDGKPSW